VGGLDEIAVSLLAFEKQADDASFLVQGAANGFELFIARCLQRARGGGDQPIDEFLRIAAMPALCPAGNQYALIVPAAELLDGDPELFSDVLNAVLEDLD